MRVFALIIFVSLAYSAHAQTEGFTCKPDGNQQELNKCQEDRYDANDKKLNVAYKEKMAALDAPAQQKLLTEQRHWLSTLKPHCKKAANDEAEGGSMWPMLYLGCLADETQKRTVILKKAN